MERLAMDALVAWRTSSRRKPLLLLGARQVGKTWLLREFGTHHYARTVRLNLDRSQTARSIFDDDLTVARLLADMATLDGGGPIVAAETLIILDEIQEAPRALTALKYFAEDAPEYHVACAGSLLGVAAHERTSFPVGKVNVVKIHPLSFVEYLGGIGEPGLAELVRHGEPGRFAAFHDALVAHLRSYLFVGGMPEAVAEYAPARDLGVVRDVQHELLAAYDRDFSKHAPLSEVPRLRALWDAVPEQLARENKRFVYSQAQPGARAKTMELALQWLLDAGLVHRVRRVQTPRLPLASYADDAFKLYCVDTGLTAAAVGLGPRTLLEGSAAFTEYKGVLAEQFVLQELIAADHTPFFWSSPTGNAEVDFLLEADGHVMPLEVKAETNLQAKSLRVFRDRYQPARSVRASLRPYRDEGWLLNLPLYAVSRIAEWLPTSDSAPTRPV